MKFAVRALCVFVLVLNLAQAASDDDDLGDYVPRVEDDLVIYVPKYSVRVGFRNISGVKSSFAGQGLLVAPSSIGDLTGVASRGYHDGYVGLDTRKVVDPSGNSVAIENDGFTNSWGYQNASQVSEDGIVAMHAYEAQITDTQRHEKDPGAANGVEVTMEREMGGLFHDRVKWGVVAGVSINQILAATSAKVAASVKTTTDLYSLYGQTPPEAPYTGPGGTGSSPLLTNQVLWRDVSTKNVPDAVENRWRLRGAYATFRAGPTLFVPITGRFSANISAGLVAVYAGSSYDVVQIFTPETGDNVVQTISDGASTLLPGFYFDANLQFAMTETSGLYLGAVYQNSGSYSQSIDNPEGTSHYSTRVDLSSLQGIRAGVSFKF